MTKQLLQGTELRQQLGVRMQAVLAVNFSGKIIEANTAAKTAYDLKLGSTVKDLPLNAVERADLLRHVKRHINRGTDGGSTANVLRLTNSSNGRPILVTLEFFTSSKIPEQLIIVKTSDVGWPLQLGPLLQSIFKLSQAEVEVLQMVLEGDKVEEIARRRSSSVPTVRTQLSSIFSKTDTKTQMDCVRMIFGLALMHDNTRVNDVATES